MANHILRTSIVVTCWLAVIGSAIAASAMPDTDPYFVYNNDDSQQLADPADLQLMLGPHQTTVRDAEQVPHSSLWGHKYVAGGAGEGQQFLKPAGIIANKEEVKSDAMLPAYCEPPNPCPPGMSGEDGCLEEFENSAEFSRDYQNKQQCMCDEEHMFSCPHNQHKLQLDQEATQDSFADALERFLEKQNIVDQHKSVRAKKFREDKRAINKRDVHAQSQHNSKNPYLVGNHRVHIVAKKG